MEQYAFPYDAFNRQKPNRMENAAHAVYCIMCSTTISASLVKTKTGIEKTVDYVFG